MTDLIRTMSLAASGMEAHATRLRHIAENIANSDTPGYRRKTVGFEVEEATGLVSTGPVRLDRSALPMVYDPGHPLANADGYYAGANVDIVLEVADAREAQRSYEANLRTFDQARQMTQSLFELLRR